MTAPAKARFLQIHWLASYPATLLNRDDAGLAKRMPWGGVTRARISSQCLKRRWRMAGADHMDRAGENPWALQNTTVPSGVRTKELVGKRIMQPVFGDAWAENETTSKVSVVVLKGVYGDKGDKADSRQALFFGDPEIDWLREQVAACKDANDPVEAAEALFGKKGESWKNIRAMHTGVVGAAGLQSALFGRMVTSDPAANTDAAIHVAHAMTVHAIERELDYLTVVDDLKSKAEGDDAGSAGLFDVELTSGLYYGYVVVDVEGLVKNLSGQREVAGQVIEHLVHLIAEVSPGAKKGSTAPHAEAEFVLVEAGNRQPRTLNNAFRTPVRLNTNRMLEDSVEAMGRYLAESDWAYGTQDARVYCNRSGAALTPEGHTIEGAGETPFEQRRGIPIATIAEWAAAAVRDGTATTPPAPHMAGAAE